MKKYLAIGDVDKIQSYVFASGRLRAIRGASALLEATVQKFAESFPSGVEFLRDRGGQVVAIVDGDAHAFCKKLEKTIRLKSGGAANITTAFTEYDGSNFRQTLKEIFHKIHTEKDGRQQSVVNGAALLTNPYYRRCHFLPTQPASMFDEVGEPGDGDERYLSKAAVSGKEAVKDIDFDKKLLAKMGCTDPLYKLPYQLDDLWATEKVERAYMGFIAADVTALDKCSSHPRLNSTKISQKSYMIWF